MIVPSPPPRTQRFSLHRQFTANFIPLRVLSLILIINLHLYIYEFFSKILEKVKNVRFIITYLRVILILTLGFDFEVIWRLSFDFSIRRIYFWHRKLRECQNSRRHVVINWITLTSNRYMTWSCKPLMAGLSSILLLLTGLWLILSFPPKSRTLCCQLISLRKIWHFVKNRAS